MVCHKKYFFTCYKLRIGINFLFPLDNIFIYIFFSWKKLMAIVKNNSFIFLIPLQLKYYKYVKILHFLIIGLNTIRFRLNFYNSLLYSFHFLHILLLFTLCCGESERKVEITRGAFGGERRHEVFGVLYGLECSETVCVYYVSWVVKAADLVARCCRSPDLNTSERQGKAPLNHRTMLSTRLSTVLPSLLYTNTETLQYSRIWFSTSKRENI